GNVPVVCPPAGPWEDDHSLGRVLLNEILCNELARRRVSEALRQFRSPRLGGPVVTAVSTPPDLVTLAAKIHDLRRRGACVYPDPPLSSLELDVLTVYHPSVTFLTPVQCRATNLARGRRSGRPAAPRQGADPDGGSQPLLGMTVQLSVSEPDPGT